MDSSGFSHSSGSEWRSVRFKTTRKWCFHALHNVVDTDTLMVYASRARVRPGGDKGYLSKKNVQFIADLGAYAAIEPKKSARARSKGYPAYIAGWSKTIEQALRSGNKLVDMGRGVLWRPCSV